MFTWPDIDIDRLRTDRRERLTALMREQGLSHLLLTGFDHIRYASDYRTQIIAEAFDWFAAVVDADGAVEIFAPWVDEEVKSPDPDLPWIRAIHPVPSWAPAVGHPVYWATHLGRALAGAGRVGHELIDPQVLNRLGEAAPETDFVPVGHLLYELRIEKTAEEITLLDAASKVNARAATAALAAAGPGLADFDVLAAAMESAQRDGAEFLSHSLCNHRRGSGTWFGRGSTLREGDAYFFDIGLYGVHGYGSDIARTGFVGEPPRAVQDAYRALITAHHIGEEAAKPGARASEVDAAVNGYLESQGLPRTPYAMGHGVGLRACELPTIHRAHLVDRDFVLRENSVISLEPETGVWVGEQFVLLKVEDNYHVRTDGLRRLSDAEYALGLT
ncbi:M24 family metallopeptidase [Streptomyces sp. NPDC055078]